MHDTLQLVLAVAILSVLVSVAVYATGRVRAKTLQQEPTADELLTKFHDLHSQGVLDDAEYRTIKTTLTAELQQELKANDQTG
jgi:hypothetical protein